MARIHAVPFALPTRPSTRRAPLLGLPQFIVVAAGVLLIPLTIVALLYPIGLEAWAKREVLSYRAAFGFDVGAVPTGDGRTDWGITSVTPGGLAERAGFRAGDRIRTKHGTPGGFLRSDLEDAAAGREACLEVYNAPAALAGLPPERTVCLGRP